MCSKRLPNRLIKKSFRAYNTAGELVFLILPQMCIRDSHCTAQIAKAVGAFLSFALFQKLLSVLKAVELVLLLCKPSATL